MNAQVNVSAGGPGPRPAAVRGNGWREVVLPDAASFAPYRPMSVIVPCFEQQEELALTLAGLERQRFPRGLFEVVVVDDGSEPPLAPPSETTLELRVVRQERRGFGLARARNAGARAAAHDILVFLDGDMIPEAEMLAAHARWHETVSDALTLGFRRYVSVRGIGAGEVRNRRGSLEELFRGRPSDPHWIEGHLARTDELTAPREDLFRVITGANFAVGRAFFEEVGGFDESFARWGGEDTEFAYRAQVRGGLLVPVRAAANWHQGRWNDGRKAKRRSQALQAPELARRIAEPSFRPDPCAGPCAVPRHAVSLDARGAPAERILEAIDALLADPAGDLAVLVDMEPTRRADRAHIVDWLGEEARARLAPPAAAHPGRGLAPWQLAALDACPASPFLVRVPVAARPDSALAARLRRGLGEAVTAHVALADGNRIEIVQSWALARARRAGGLPTDYGEERVLPPTFLSAAADPSPAPAGAAACGRRRLPAVAARVLAEARHVHGARTAWHFLRWFAGGVRWRLREGSGWKAAPVPAVPVHADPPLGVAVAPLGPRAVAAFAASSCTLRGPRAARADVVLAGTAANVTGSGAPVAALDAHPALATPAFDPAHDNPAGWVRDVEPRRAALGDPRLLPADAPADLSAGDRQTLTHCHHLVDIAAFHDGAERRAGALARIAAWGVPVRLADRDPALERLLGDELGRLMRSGATEAAWRGDARERELLSIAMRREALRTHSLRARARQVCAAAGAEAPPLPLVSVTLATCRPALLRAAAANVAMQTYPRLELVLALHGPGFGAEQVEAALHDFKRPVKLLRLGADLPLGAVLQAAAAAAGGSLLAKMDAAAAYGPEHLWDLVLAREYSGAALVGKFPATVYLSRLDRTVRRRAMPAEVFSHDIAGAALLLSRTDLARAGGWRPLPRREDKALIEDVARAGGTVYRTHDTGFLCVRHGAGHTWEADDERFLAGAESVLDGWCPRLAGIDAAPPLLAGAGVPLSSSRRGA